MADAILDNDRKEYHEPSAEERENYYYGLAGKPKLVARTGRDHWVKPHHLRSAWVSYPVWSKKYFWPIRDDDEIVSKWSKELATIIVKTLEPYPWSHFFPVKTPLEADDCLDEKQISKINEQQPIILLIAILKNSMGWETGIKMAFECLKVLHNHDIFIEVEVYEGAHQRNAISAELESKIDPIFWSPAHTIYLSNANKEVLPLLSYSGYAVGYLKDHHKWGTIGLHVTLGRSKKVYGLTCRHVVDSGQPLTRSYDASRKDQRQYHIHGTDSIVAGALENLKDLQTWNEAGLKKLYDKQTRWELSHHMDTSESSRRPTKSYKDTIVLCEATHKYTEELIESVKKVSASTNNERIIGHLAFYPRFEISTRILGYMRDWALIELDKQKYPDGFENKVYLGDLPRTNEFDYRFKRFDGSLVDLEPRSKHPEELLYHSAEKKSFIVAKRGAASGVSLGTINAIEAVVRGPKPDGGHYASWEMLIIPEGGKGKFSEGGDSGSCVFDENCQVVGMVVGSSLVRNSRVPDGSISPEEDTERGDETTDITFAVAIDQVFDDIEEFTGSRPRLVGY
ncbi:hypothetical protein F4777DRAFT_512575 [Nemania sp. FL0916]|nr:hypothetical protein F4777DRAFT_512575 [Nemania sp. FL0916]